MSNKRRTKDGKVILSDQGGKYTVEYGKDAIPYENTGNKTWETQFLTKREIEILKEISETFQNWKLNK